MKDKTRTEFIEYLEVAKNDVAAAILVLADVIRHKRFIDEGSAENLAHEIALLFKHMSVPVAVSFSESIDINADLSNSGDALEIVTREAQP